MSLFFLLFQTQEKAAVITLLTLELAVVAVDGLFVGFRDIGVGQRS